MKNQLPRRLFLERLAMAGGLSAIVATPKKGEAATSIPKQPLPLCVFSKHLQFLDYKELAKTCREVGLDGVDLTVRDGGHVAPEKVHRDLPAAVEAIRSEGLEVPMITTRLNNASDKDTRRILEVASKQGIRYFRIDGHKYDLSRPILPQLDRFTEELRGLAQLAAKCDMVAGYHNHSGHARVGAPVWDLHRIFEAVQSPHLGSNFDVGHATVEGALGDWQITAQLMAPYVKMMALKDFFWENNKPRWTSLGKGVVDVGAFFKIFRTAGFQGPVSLHFEYPIKKRDALIQEVADAVTYVRKIMQ